MTVKFYDSIDDSLLEFAVIIAKAKGKWVYCKHRERNTFEIPGGRRDWGESIQETAVRELKEETGALEFSIEPIGVYSVVSKGNVKGGDVETFGMMFYAEIVCFAKELDSEIEKVCFFDSIPEALTYPEIQPKLVEEFERRKQL